MKKTILFLFLSCILFSCSDSDNEQDDPTTGKQDHTSLTITNETRNIIPTLIIASFQENKYHQLKKVSNFEIGNKTEELTIEESNIKNIYIFTSDFMTGDYYRTTDAISLLKNNKNDFKYTSSMKAVKVNDINDPAQFPF